MCFIIFNTSFDKLVLWQFHIPVFHAKHHIHFIIYSSSISRIIFFIVKYCMHFINIAINSRQFILKQSSTIYNNQITIFIIFIRQFQIIIIRFLIIKYRLRSVVLVYIHFNQCCQIYIVLSFVLDTHYWPLSYSIFVHKRIKNKLMLRNMAAYFLRIINKLVFMDIVYFTKFHGLFIDQGLLYLVFTITFTHNNNRNRSLNKRNTNSRFLRLYSTDHV